MSLAGLMETLNIAVAEGLLHFDLVSLTVGHGRYLWYWDQPVQGVPPLPAWVD